MSWKRTKAKEPLYELFPSLIEDRILLYKEIENKVYIRYTYMQAEINLSDFNKYLDPVVTNGKIEEVSSDLSNYLDDVIKKAKKKG